MADFCFANVVCPYAGRLGDLHGNIQLVHRCSETSWLLDAMVSDQLILITLPSSPVVRQNTPEEPVILTQDDFQALPIHGRLNSNHHCLLAHNGLFHGNFSVNAGFHDSWLPHFVRTMADRPDRDWYPNVQQCTKRQWELHRVCVSSRVPWSRCVDFGLAGAVQYM